MHFQRHLVKKEFKKILDFLDNRQDLNNERIRIADILVYTIKILNKTRLDPLKHYIDHYAKILWEFMTPSPYVITFFKKETLEGQAIKRAGPEGWNKCAEIAKAEHQKYWLEHIKISAPFQVRNIMQIQNITVVSPVFKMMSLIIMTNLVLVLV